MSTTCSLAACLTSSTGGGDSAILGGVAIAATECNCMQIGQELFVDRLVRV